VTPTASLDRVLELLEHQRRSAAELRLLVALADQEMTVAELADRLGDRSLEDVAHTTRRLSTAGLIRYRLTHDRGETVLSITCSGLVAIRPLLTLLASPGKALGAPLDPRGSETGSQHQERPSDPR
jgi:DNA-binding MarR family transcriptional regulator